jgi:hypothetical protein
VGKRVAFAMTAQEHALQHYRATFDDGSFSLSIYIYICNNVGKTCLEKMWQRSPLAGSRRGWEKSRPARGDVATSTSEPHGPECS